MSLKCFFGHQWNGCKCEKCGKIRNEQHTWQNGACSVCGAKWIPTNPRLASNMPLSSLLRVFIFTNRDGRTVLNCPVAMGTLSDTAGTSPNEISGKVPVDIIAKSNVATQCEQTGQFPLDAWVAMTNINADIAGKAQMGVYKTVIRPVTNPNTGESSCCVLIYQK